MSRLKLHSLFCLLAAFFAAPSIAFDTVIIDAGHGGHDRGGVPGQRVAEKHVALDTARRLERELDKAGLRTVMTRKGDYFVTLGRRVSIANRYRNAIFVSVHYNSARRRGARGLETYYYRGANSRRLAYRIQSNILRAVSTENRGVKSRGFYVIRRTAMPAVLVECGFLTNPYEARLFSRSANRQKMAEKIARGILQYRNDVRRSRGQRPLQVMR